MNPMAINRERRRLLQGSAACLLAWALPTFAGETPLHVLSAYDVGRNQHRAGIAGSEFACTLPARGHFMLPIHGAASQCITFARRPGQYIARIDWQSGQQLAWYDYPENRHGFGHGILLDDGNLITTDSDIDTGNGLITVRDGQTLAAKQEFSSGGIGPHQLLAMPDNQLLVANGGILTLPESGRIKLNRNSMQPSLDVLDIASGQQISQHFLNDHRLSIRHLAQVSPKQFAVALQFEGEGGAPLAARWNDTQGLSLLPLPHDVSTQCQGYAATIAANPELIACTATKGDRVVFWSASGRYLAAVPLNKPAGIAPTADGRFFIVSNEDGLIVWINSQTLSIDPSRTQQYPVRWDNHLTLV